MSLKGPTKLTENNLAQLNSQGLSLGPCDDDEDSNSKKRSATTKSAPESATLKPVMGLPKQPVDAFAKLRSLLRQKAAKKNTSPSAVGKSTRNVSPVPKFGSRSLPVKLEKSSSTSSRESAVYDSAEGSGIVLSSSEGSSASEPKKITRRKILAKNKSTIVGTDDNETHPASSTMNVATLARIQKKRRLLQAAMDDRRKQQKKL